jgi:type IV pilus assembly protein PilQ
MVKLKNPMWIQIKRTLLLGSLLLTALVGSAAHAQGGSSLTGISYASLPGERVEVRMELSSAAKNPLVFAIDNPSRIAIDFPGVRLALPKKTTGINLGMARSVTAVEAGGRTRVVLNLIKLVPYEVIVEGNVAKLILDSADATASSALGPQLAAIGPAARPGTQASQARSVRRIDNIDFRRGREQEGRVIVTLSDPGTVIDTREEGSKIIVEFSGTALPARLERKLDVIDFATPVLSVDTFAESGIVRIVIETGGEFEHIAYQSDNLFTIDIKPLSKEQKEAARKAKFGYNGERLSLNFQNIEVRAVLQLIADFTGLNLVASDTVAGSLTLRLKNVPWDQALDIILKSKGLAMRQAGNVIMVAPSEEITAREKLELESAKQITELAPLQTEFVQLNYASATDMASLLKASGNSLLTDRGSVTVDERTNTLLIRDTRLALEAARSLVTQLDIPVRQVLIESRIVVADNNYSKDLGVQFGFSRTDTLDNNRHFFSLGGKQPGDTTFGNPATTTAFATENQENYIVDLPLAGPSASLGFAIGKLGSTLLQLELQAMQAEGRGEVLSNPRVITSNQKTATIEQGTEIPFQEASSSGAATTAFKKAVLSLQVKPQITPDDRVIMDLEVNQDTIGQVFGGIPSIDTRAVRTQVLVDNGETVVLGGIYEQTEREDVEKVPFFGDLPYVGRLFRQDSTQNNRSELLIFVTPKIVKESLSL